MGERGGGNTGSMGRDSAGQQQRPDYSGSNYHAVDYGERNDVHAGIKLLGDDDGGTGGGAGAGRPGMRDGGGYEHWSDFDYGGKHDRQRGDSDIRECSGLLLCGTEGWRAGSKSLRIDWRALHTDRGYFDFSNICLGCGVGKRERGRHDVPLVQEPVGGLDRDKFHQAVGEHVHGACILLWNDAEVDCEFHA